jgi:hypothetical protein
MVLIPKGKGDLADPGSWRGISKKAVMGKLFASLLARRLLRFLTNCDLLPLKQHGFLPGRSTSSAIEALMGYIDRHMRVGGTPVYALFVDFKAAFNTASRSAIIVTLGGLGVSGPFLDLINDMMAPNVIKLYDGVSLLPGFNQETGLPQGDTIASLLFVVLLLDLTPHVENAVPAVAAELYADDLLLLCLTLLLLKEAIRVARDFAAEKGLEINWEKTKVMKFRRGGRLAANDVLSVDGVNIPFVSSFCYLGLTLTVTASTFTHHVLDRKSKAITTINSLPPLPQLSLSSAVELFNIKVSPMATYAIRNCWSFLKVTDFGHLDSVLFTFLKRTLGVSNFSRSRMVLLLTEAKLVTERMMQTFDLPMTANFERYITRVQEKLDSIDPEFLGTHAMTDRRWTEPMAQGRSAICRMAMHGFHHIFCASEGFHSASPTCLCRFCGNHCQTYHSMQCRLTPFASISLLAAVH